MTTTWTGMEVLADSAHASGDALGCYSPDLVPLRELVRLAGRRWTVEESFQAGKSLAGLDEHQVRRWTS